MQKHPPSVSRFRIHEKASVSITPVWLHQAAALDEGQLPNPQSGSTASWLDSLRRQIGPVSSGEGQATLR
jgi:hypothetical protein